LPLVLTTVQKIAYNDGIGAAWDEEYSYEGGSYYVTSTAIRERKFAGFRLVSRTDDSGFVTKQYFHQGDTSSSTIGEFSDHVAKIGKVFRTEVYDNSSNLYAKTINKWDRFDKGDSASFVKPLQTADFSYDGDSDHKEKVIALTFASSTGNLTEKIEWGQVTGSDDGSFTDTGTDKFTTTYSYATTTPASSSTLLSVESAVDQSSNKVRERRIYYDGLALGSFEKGNATKEELWKAGSTYVDTEKTYNNYGLVTQDKDPRDKTTTYTYDSLNLYQATSTNPVSHVTSRLYDFSSGKVTQVVEPNGRVFEITYDSLDRLKEEKQPDLTTPTTRVTKTAYTYTDTGFPTKVQKTSYLESATSSESYIYVDGFGRKSQERTEAETTYAARDFQYDQRGLLKNESLPYFSVGTSYTATTSPATGGLLIRYAYDPLERVKSITTNVGTTTQAYDDWTLTVTDPEGSVKDLSSDAYGNLVQVVEHNATSTYTTAYEWNGLRKLTKITDAEANVRNFTYDGLSRRLTAQDLHDAGDGTFGTWTYAYDDAGSMTSSTDPKSQTVTLTYDDLNRPLTEDYTGSAGTEVSYFYDACTDGKGHLCAATSTAATATFTYNPLGLTASETKIVSSTVYTTTYSYDRQGNKTLIVYPDSSEVRLSYNSAGLLEKVAQKESGGSFADIVTNFDYGPHGKVTVKDFANGVTSEYTYESAELYRLTRILTAPGGEGGGDADSIYWDGSRFLYFEGGEVSASELQRLLALASEEGLPGEPLGSAETVSEEAPSSTPEADPDGVSIEEPPQAEPEVLGASTTEVLPPAAEPPVAAVEVDAVSAATTTVAASSTAEKSPALPPDDPRLKLKAPMEDILGLTEDASGVVKYAYRTDIRVDALPASPEVVAGAAGSGLAVAGEVVEGRTKYSRTFGTSDSAVFLTEIVSGDPRYYRDANGDWWLAEYATTTRESYDYQTKPEEGNLVTRIRNFISDLFFPKAYAAESTFYPDANPESNSVDGFVINFPGGGASYATVHDASAGTEAHDDPVGYSHIEVANMSASGYRVYRGFILFHTAAIPDNHSVTSSTLYLYVTAVDGNANSDSLSIVTSTPASNTGLVVGDFDQLGTTKLATDIAFSSLTTSAYNAFPLNASGLAAISTSSVTKLGLRTAQDISATTPTGVNSVSIQSADDGGTTTGPKLVVVHAGAPLDGSIQDLNYTYDDVGNITQLADYSGTGTGKVLVFTYDDLNRLLVASTTAASSTPFRQSWTLSAMGNVLGFATSSGATTTYAYAETGTTNPQAPTSIGSASLAYDANGNLLSYASSTYAWDWRNRLTTSTVSGATTTFAYDHTFERVKKTQGATSTVYANDLYNTRGTTKTKHIYAGGELVATIETVGATSTVRYIHADHLGSVNAVTDAAGDVVQAADYYPYGEQRIDTGSYDEQRRYIGEDYDPEASLSYLNARYYEGPRGGFLSQDPVFWEVGVTQDGMSVLSNPQLQNSYSYAGNNPIIGKDPNGRCPICLVAVGALAMYAPQATTYLSSLTTPVGQYAISEAFQDAQSGSYGWAAFGLLTAGEGSGAGRYSDEAVAKVKNVLGPEYERLVEQGGERAALLLRSSNSKVQNLVKSLYKPTDQIPGGTAGAAIYTKISGQTVENKTHILKVYESLNRVRNIFKSVGSGLSSGDKAVLNYAKSQLTKAESILKGLLK
jgi:RHS repeat-associated protein